MNLRKNNIVMLGMTGVGKTTIGKILSKVIKAKFIDIDYEIEKASNLKVYDFFSQYGENEFRKLEKKVFLMNQKRVHHRFCSQKILPPLLVHFSPQYHCSLKQLSKDS